MEEIYPKVDKDLIGKHIEILYNNGNAKVRVGQQYTIQFIRGRRIYFDNKWWNPGNNPKSQCFKLIKYTDKILIDMLLNKLEEKWKMKN